MDYKYRPLPTQGVFTTTGFMTIYMEATGNVILYLENLSPDLEVRGRVIPYISDATTIPVSDEIKEYIDILKNTSLHSADLGDISRELSSASSFSAIRREGSQTRYNHAIEHYTTEFESKAIRGVKFFADTNLYDFDKIEAVSSLQDAQRTELGLIHGQNDIEATALDDVQVADFVLQVSYHKAYTESSLSEISSVIIGKTKDAYDKYVVRMLNVYPILNDIANMEKDHKIALLEKADEIAGEKSKLDTRSQDLIEYTKTYLKANTDKVYADNLQLTKDLVSLNAKIKQFNALQSASDTLGAENVEVIRTHVVPLDNTK